MREIVVLLLLSGTAHADVVMPPPDRCPEGQVPTTSHEGATCAPAAPTDCLAGWRGVIGGECVLDTCSADESCGPGKRCVAQELCFRPWVHRQKHSNELVMGARAEDICASSCQAPGECRPSRVCLPVGVSAAAGAPGRPAAVLDTAARVPRPGPVQEENRGWPRLVAYGAGGAILAVAILVIVISRRRRR